MFALPGGNAVATGARVSFCFIAKNSEVIQKATKRAQESTKSAGVVNSFSPLRLTREVTAAAEVPHPLGSPKDIAP